MSAIDLIQSLRREAKTSDSSEYKAVTDLLIDAVDSYRQDNPDDGDSDAAVFAQSVLQQVIRSAIYIAAQQFNVTGADLRKMVEDAFEKPQSRPFSYLTFLDDKSTFSPTDGSLLLRDDYAVCYDLNKLVGMLSQQALDCVRIETPEKAIDAANESLE